MMAAGAAAGAAPLSLHSRESRFSRERERGKQRLLFQPSREGGRPRCLGARSHCNCCLDRIPLRGGTKQRQMVAALKRHNGGRVLVLQR